MDASKLSWKCWLSRIPGVRQGWGCCRRLFDWGLYTRDLARFSSLASSAGRERPRWRDRYPCLGQKTCATEFDRHYVYHTSWAARVLARTRPTRHVDFSSSLCFVGVASAFVPMEHYDFRVPNLTLDSLTTGFADLLHLPYQDRSLASLSCMHVVEHIGLGRYGDLLDAEGDTKAMRELARVLAPGGNLIFVTPVGRPRVCFNAHRIYSPAQILEYFNGLDLVEFSAVDDRGELLIDARLEQVENAVYGCGLFWLRRNWSSR